MMPTDSQMIKIIFGWLHRYAQKSDAVILICKSERASLMRTPPVLSNTKLGVRFRAVVMANHLTARHIRQTVLTIDLQQTAKGRSHTGEGK